MVNAVRMLRAGFVLAEPQILEIADSFQKAMADGLAGKQSSLKMLPSYLTKPTGIEKGVYLAVDFGGTNVRVLTVELKGSGAYQTLGWQSFPLQDRDYNFTSPKATGHELFSFIAEKIKSMLSPGRIYPLGLTFSFPSRQTGVDRAILIKWTKEIQTSGVEGHDVSEILKRALVDKNITQVIPKAIINDTVGTLLTASYIDQSADIGSICGTGHNTCYIEPKAPITGQPMIINMESGNFDNLPLTDYDIKLDRQSQAPGEQRLEKMVGGQYIGELVRLIIQDFIDKKLLFKESRPEIFYSPYHVKSEDVALLLADTSPDLKDVDQWLKTKGHISGSLIEERITLRSVASIVIIRAVQLVAATYTGVIMHIDPGLTKRHTIAIDGSLYELMPGFANKLSITLNNIFKGKHQSITTKLTKDGSGVGAAIAAASVDQTGGTPG
ncbi:hexokinase family protein [Desulfallas thermosapovorans]|uniref:Hexokinase n=1 Tax=Desulfallas thermosapovorans DSM 6562 TaxID=1121431 RepID=A0A5S4ZR06_9FIRM|nr:hexokinase [Desulfallas thermosapovorans]TYO95053.1 hexokinase [Desulfallas thermosapovorans DSM 6562]